MSDFNVDYDQLKGRKVENGDIIPLGSDAEYVAEFTMEKVPNFDGTDFTEVVHIRLQAPGNTRTVYHQPARMEGSPGHPSDPERFPREWAAFQAGRSGHTGTSIYEWEGVTPGDARRFDLYGIKTVEQLAHVSDGNLAQLGMGALALREKARKFITGDSTETQLRQQLGEQNDQIEKLTAVVNNLLEKLGETEPKPKGKKADAPAPLSA